MPGREGGKRTRSKFLSSKLAVWGGTCSTQCSGNLQSALESQPLRTCAVPALAQVSTLSSRSSRVPSHPIQDASWIGSRAHGFSLQRGILLHVLASWVPQWSTFSPNISFYPHTHSARKDYCAHYAEWGSNAAVQSVCIPPGSSVGQAISPSPLHLGPGAQ